MGHSKAEEKASRSDVELLAPGQEAEWDDFVPTAGRGTLFHTAWWHRAWQCKFEIFVRRQNGRIVSGMVANYTRFLGQAALRPPPFSPENGPLVATEGQLQPRAALTHNRREVSELLARLPKLASYHILLGQGFQDPAPFLWSGFDFLPGWTYVIPADTPRWRENLSTDRRRKLKQAREQIAEQKLVVRDDLGIADVVPLLRDTAETKGFSLRSTGVLLPSLWQAVAARGAGKVYGLCQADGTVVSALLLVWDHACAYYLGGGMTPELRRTSHLNSTLFERMIDDSQARRLTFDFEGSVQPGIDQFFRAWGGEQRPTLRVVKLRSPLSAAIWQIQGYLTRHRAPIA